MHFFIEKSGGIQRESLSQLDFKSWATRYNLMEIETKIAIFTWNNRTLGFSYIEIFLDRFFFIGDLLAFPFLYKLHIFPSSGSDQFPIQLDIMGEKNL